MEKYTDDAGNKRYEIIGANTFLQHNESYDYEQHQVEYTTKQVLEKYIGRANTEATRREIEIEHELRSVEVPYGTRKLKCTWSPEMANDIYLYHGIDVEEELLSHLSNELAKEIDKGNRQRNS